MVDESSVDRDKIGRKTLVIIAAACLGSVLIVTALAESLNNARATRLKIFIMSEMFFYCFIYKL